MALVSGNCELTTVPGRRERYRLHVSGPRRRRTAKRVHVEWPCADVSDVNEPRTQAPALVVLGRLLP